jgi:hypothetical protein
MAYSWNKNVQFNMRGDASVVKNPTAEFAIFSLKQALSGAGWNVPQWSDGVTLYSGGHLLTSWTQITASRAWVRVQMPSTTREFIFQRSSTAGNANSHFWRVKYCPKGGFTTGATATVTPSATIEYVLCGGGTDASPTPGSPFGFTPGATPASEVSFTCNIVVDNAVPYGFCLWGCDYLLNPVGRIFCDPLLNGTSGSNDEDAYVVCCQNGVDTNGWSGTGLTSETTSVNGMACFFSASITAGSQCTNVIIPSMALNAAATVIAPRNLGTNTYSYKEEAPRAFYVRRAAATPPNGYKGVSTLFRMGTTYRTSGELLSFATKNDYIRIGDIWVVWDGGASVT